VTHRDESPGSGLLRVEAYIKDHDGPWIEDLHATI